MKGLLFTYALCYGGAFASLFKPWVGVLVYVAFAILRPDALWYWEVPPGNYSRIVAIALLVGWAVRGFGNWRLGRATAMIAALVGFLIWCALSATRAVDQDLAWKFVDLMSKIVLPVVVGATLIDRPRQLKQLAWTIVLAEGYVALEMNRFYFSGYNRLKEEGFGGGDNNYAAIGMVACIGLGLFLALSERSVWRRCVALFCLAVTGHALMLAFSRGALLSLVLTGVVSFAMMPKQPKHVFAFVVLLLVAARLAGPQLLDRFNTTFADSVTRDASAQSRLDLWKDCLDSIQKRPIFGVGPDHWPIVAEQYGWPRGKEAHTLWLQTAAEIGLPGVALLAGYYALCVVRLRPLRAPGADPLLADVARMVTASLVGFAFAAQFVSVEGLEIPYYVGLLGAGALKLASADDQLATLPAQS